MPCAFNPGTLVRPHRNSALAFWTGFVWLRLGVERKREAYPAVMAFKNKVFKIEQVLHFVRAKKSPQLTEDREGNQDDR